MQYSVPLRGPCSCCRASPPQGWSWRGSPRSGPVPSSQCNFFFCPWKATFFLLFLKYRNSVYSFIDLHSLILPIPKISLSKSVFYLILHRGLERIRKSKWVCFNWRIFIYRMNMQFILTQLAQFLHEIQLKIIKTPAILTEKRRTPPTKVIFALLCLYKKVGIKYLRKELSGRKKGTKVIKARQICSTSCNLPMESLAWLWMGSQR